MESENVLTKQQRIAENARRLPQVSFTSLAYHMDVSWLKEAWRRTRKDGAVGVDNQSAGQYAENLEENLKSLLERAKSGSYKAPPVRRVHIPKGSRGTETRPIGIPTLEDKVLQRAVQMVLEPAGHGDDKRKESRRPNLDTLSTQGQPLSADHNWRARKAVIDPMPVTTLTELVAGCDRDGTSLGIVRPSRVHDIEVTQTGGEWSSEQLASINQLALFDRSGEPLRKMPFELHYVFECEDDDTHWGPHRALITDWDLAAFYFKEERRLGDPGKAAVSTKDRFLKALCGRKMDPVFFMGTSGAHDPCHVLGVFYPERDSQLSLLD